MMIATAVFAVLMASCTNSQIGPSTTRPIEEVLIDGLATPTQFVRLNETQMLIAQLNGDENDKHGQVLVVDQITKKKRVLINDLDKPTGVAYLDGTIWIMVKRGLIKASWDGTSAKPQAIQQVLSDLPFNGRSEGTLTPLADGRLLYETSGNTIGETVEAASGNLWAYNPETKTSTMVATGLKNAYAHTVMKDGRILATEISGENSNPPPDAVVVVEPNQATPPNFGWPTCRPDAHDDSRCATVTKPLVTLPKNSTPTGIAAIGNKVYVALWVTGDIVQIDLNAPQTKTVPVAFGLTNPHTVIADGPQHLLFSDAADRIVRLAIK